jgi:hypothetical protein
VEALPSLEARVRPRPAGTPVPLTAWQRCLWNDYSQGHRSSDERQCGASLRIRGQLDEGLLRRTIDMVVERHESLRTRIVVAAGTPIQEIAPASANRVEVIDLAGGSAGEVWESAEQFSNRFLYEQIDWSRDSPFSAKLLKLSELDHLLLVGIDEMVADGGSMGIVGRDITSLYLKGGPLPGPPLQFGDYAYWQQTTLDAWRSKHELYWRERMSRVPRVDALFDDSRQEQGCLKWTLMKYALGAELSATLRMIAWREKMVLPLVLLGIVAAVLSRWCSQSEWAVNLQSHGRQGHPEFVNTVGHLTTVLQLYFDVREDENLLDLMKRIHLEYQTALEHLDYGRLPDCVPISQAPITFNWIGSNAIRPGVTLPVASAGQVEITPFPLFKTYGNLSAPYRSLYFSVSPEDGQAAPGTVIDVGRQQDLVSSSNIDRLGRSIRLLAEQFAANPLVMQRMLRLVS